MLCASDCDGPLLGDEAFVVPPGNKAASRFCPCGWAAGGAAVVLLDICGSGDLVVVLDEDVGGGGPEVWFPCASKNLANREDRSFPLEESWVFGPAAAVRGG